MLTYTLGTAIIQHNESLEQFEISSDSLDWDITETHNRNMGVETTYEASVEHEALGTLTWYLYEYPINAQNFKQADVGEHTIIKDFDYGLVHEPEFEIENHKTLESILKDKRLVAALSDETVVYYLVNWFRSLYEDPVHSLPHVSSEGGYQYIYGGPYDASDVFQEFLHSVPETLIEKAVNEVESDGTIQWTPTESHPDRIAAREEYRNEYNGKPLKEIITKEMIESTVNAYDNAKSKHDFLRHYDFDFSRKWFLEIDGKKYPPKGIVGIACRINCPDYPLTDFTPDRAVRLLKHLGFVVKKYDVNDVDLNKIQQEITNEYAFNFGTKVEVQIRHNIKITVSTLKEELEKTDSRFGIGGNNPPEKISLHDDIIKNEVKNIDIVTNELENKKPNVTKIIEKTKGFESTLKSIAKKAKVKFADFCDAAIKGAGKKIGVIIAENIVDAVDSGITEAASSIDPSISIFVKLYLQIKKWIRSVTKK